MGFESFQIELKGGPATPTEVFNTLLTTDGVSRDEDAELTPRSPCFLLRDARHAIEMELTYSPQRLSCRFTVCHPPTVDAVFLDLIHRFMERFGMQARICDDVTPEDSRSFSLAEFDDFARATRGYIASRRREWHGAFGDQQLGATTAELCEQILLPLCQTPAEKAG